MSEKALVHSTYLTRRIAGK